jgi:uncharacterized protein YecE (DUF72 family)
MKRRIIIGTAGWSLPRAEQGHFPGAGSHLERYGSRFAGVEINSSFHRSHKPAIWTRWRDAVPASFRFSVKMPKAITHTARLNVTRDVTFAFIEEISILEAKLGCLLVQLPPSLVFDAGIAEPFFKNVKATTPVPIACEPRHESWFARDADKFLRDLGVAASQRTRHVFPPPLTRAEAGNSPTFGYTDLRRSITPPIQTSLSTASPTDCSAKPKRTEPSGAFSITPLSEQPPPTRSRFRPRSVSALTFNFYFSILPS